MATRHRAPHTGYWPPFADFILNSATFPHQGASLWELATQAFKRYRFACSSHHFGICPPAVIYLIFLGILTSLPYRLLDFHKRFDGI
jgi:hypothetical protein